jgi:hypothetical protein
MAELEGQHRHCDSSLRAESVRKRSTLVLLLSCDDLRIDKLSTPERGLDAATCGALEQCLAEGHALTTPPHGGTIDPVHWAAINARFTGPWCGPHGIRR